MAYTHRFCTKCKEKIKVGPNVAECPIHKGSYLIPSPKNKKERKADKKGRFIPDDSVSRARIRSPAGWIVVTAGEYKNDHYKIELQPVIEFQFLLTINDGTSVPTSSILYFKWDDPQIRKLYKFLQDAHDNIEADYEEAAAEPSAIITNPYMVGVSA